MDRTIRKGSAGPTENDCEEQIAEAWADYDEEKEREQSSPMAEPVEKESLEDIFQSFGDFVAQETARAKANAAPSQEDEMPACSVEDSPDKPKAVTAKQYQQATKFQVGSAVDEAGLSAIEFRIYAHLVRRADKDGECFPSIDVICQWCKCTRQTASTAIAVLEERRFITCRKRFHQSTVYTLHPAQDWCSLMIE
jgi:Helix-turn-helix domain